MAVAAAEGVAEAFTALASCLQRCLHTLCLFFLSCTSTPFLGISGAAAWRKPTVMHACSTFLRLKCWSILMLCQAARLGLFFRAGSLRRCAGARNVSFFAELLYFRFFLHLHERFLVCARTTFDVIISVRWWLGCLCE